MLFVYLMGWCVVHFSPALHTLWTLWILSRGIALAYLFQFFPHFLDDLFSLGLL